MTSPAFSIIIPTCGRPAMLRRALQSVVNQTFADFECVVVDDAGEPGAAATIQPFDDARITVVRHEQNRGAATAYNTGIKASRGGLICVLDDDDEYAPTFLEKTRAFFHTASVDIGFVWTGINEVRDTPEGEEVLGERIWPARFPSREEAYIEATTIGNGFGLTMRRRCLDDVGLYNEDFRVCVDTEHLFRLAAAVDFAAIPEALVTIHHHQNGQLTHRDKDQLRLALHERILSENADFLADYPNLAFVHYRRLAEICYALNLKRKGGNILLRLWQKSPCRISILVDWFLLTACGVDLNGIKQALKKILA
jgi:glycosyltransferase involved in cell wall biosynthesis